MIMLKTLSKDLAPVCVLSDNFKLNMEAATTTFLSKKGLKFPTGLTTTVSTSKPFCKDALLQIKSDIAPQSQKNGDCLAGFQNVALTDSHRAMLNLAKYRAEAEAASMQNNLFQAGFQDCATEVIRFLMEQESMDDGNPLIQGLQSHLSKMNNTICGESIVDLDLSPSSQIISTDCSPLISSAIKDSTLGNVSSHSQHLQQSQSLSQSSSVLFSDLISSSSSSQNLPQIDTCQESSSLKRKRFSNFTEQIPSKRICQNSIPVQEPTKKSDITPPANESVLLSYLPQSLEQSSPFFTSSSSLTAPTMPSLVNTEPSSSSSSTSSSSSLSTSSRSSSILELKAHFLPGIDSNSLASGNFADILLAVESCQSHDNPRVRELADTIIDLIHNNDDDDDDDDYDEEDEQENDQDNVDEIGSNGDDEIANNGNLNTNIDTAGSSAQHEDSGIDLGEEWCNPADMIEC